MPSPLHIPRVCSKLSPAGWFWAGYFAGVVLVWVALEWVLT
jgi:hypothetical protein